MNPITSDQTNLSSLAANNIRVLAAAMVEQANSGHPGGPMGGADFISILFAEYLIFDPEDMHWPNRDRFFLDPGHLSAMLYSSLSLMGYFSMDDLKQFRQWGSITPGHPEIDVERGIENTSGPLGQGHSFGIGAAIAERFLAHRFGEWMSHKTYLYISDGGIQEEVSQGVGRTAGYLGLGNVIMFYDANNVQLSSMVDEVMEEDTAKKYESWGWHVQTIEGNNHEEIRKALDTAIEETERPSLIVGKTIMGKGAVNEEGEKMEGLVSTHGKPLSKAGVSFERTVSNLGGDAENPFQIFPEVKAYYEEVIGKKKQTAKEKKAIQAAWEKAHPELAEKWKKFFSDTPPIIDYSAIKQTKDKATRDGSGTMLSHFADHVENMIVSSADLSDSDRTEKFLKKTTSFKKGDFSGSFLQAGVSELSMAAMCTGMALHGGVIPVCGTFFVFSDFMKPTLRLAGLMKQAVIFVWTHDAFRVGEDGPTHQPVEQEAQIRLLEKLQNHEGQNSFLVLRPADVDETTVAWKMALENKETPTGLILSRQGIKSLPVKEGSTRFQDALQAERGAYVVQDVENPDIIFVANGSEVATLIDGAEKLRSEKGLRIKVVSAISEGLFRSQDKAYQEVVLPSNIPTLGMTAGLPVTLAGLVGPKGKVIGLNHFGYSAPYKVLDEKLGYTAENVFNEAISYLEEFK